MELLIVGMVANRTDLLGNPKQVVFVWVFGLGLLVKI